MAVRNWSGADRFERDTIHAFAARNAAGVFELSPQNHSGQAARSKRVEDLKASSSRTTGGGAGAGAGAAGAFGISRGRSAPTRRPAVVTSTRAFEVDEGRSASSAFTLNLRRGGGWSSRFLRFRDFFGSGFMGSGSSSCVVERRARDHDDRGLSETAQSRKRDHPRPSFPETIHEDGVRRGNTHLLLLHVVPFVAELVVRLRVPQKSAADAPGLPSLG